ncbi:MAG: alpha/beta fold hydrolase [Bacteroidales bacterium]|nr:alpha/beta fold hydrolase [Bacteroidales bacterium]MBN2757577.1 alpha/beta fold hydrolase [Bacteroidales bacterium]
MTSELKNYFQNKAELQIISIDGPRNYISVYQPFFIKNAPVIIIMPALGVKAAYYEPIAFELQKSGYIVVSADLRGTGKSSVKVSKKRNFGYHEMIAYDWPSIIEKVNIHFPNNKIYLLGHSLGGQLNVLYASQHQKLINGLILIASCSVYYKGWNFPRNIGVLAGTQLANLLVRFLGYFPGKKIGFAATEAKNLMLDWSDNARTGKYKIRNSNINFEKDIKNIQLPILAISFNKDNLSPQKAVKLLISKIENAQITQHHCNTENCNLNHFNWVKNNDLVIRHIHSWLKKYHNL